MSRYQTYFGARGPLHQLNLAPLHQLLVIREGRRKTDRFGLRWHPSEAALPKTMPDYGAELRIADHTEIGKKKAAGRRLAMI